MIGEVDGERYILKGWEELRADAPPRVEGGVGEDPR